MSQWNQKFKYNLPSFYDYHSSLNPLYLQYLLTSKGFACPEFKHCLEIGCGSGKSILPHALTNSAISWMGQEFNPSELNKTKRLAKSCSIQVELNSDSLESLANRTDLPKFDLICLHGVWSWVSPQDQEQIINIVSRHLNDGGIFYISYNCKVGLGNFSPLRNLLNLYNDHKCPRNLDNEHKILALSKFLYPIIKLNPSFAIAQQDFGYFMQEALKNPEPFLSDALNSYWSSDHFADVAARLERADVGFVCSACGTDNLDVVNLTAAQQEFLEPLRGTALYEETRDFIVNRRVRDDIFIKGAVALNENEYLEAISSQNLVLAAPLVDFDYQMIGNALTLELDKRYYEPLIAILTDYCPHNIGQIIDAMLQFDPQMDVRAIIDALNNLVFAGVCTPAIRGAQANEAVFKLNYQTLNNFGLYDSVALCSPITQGSLNVDPIYARLLKTFVNTPNCSDKDLIEYMLTAIVQGDISISDGETTPSDQELVALVNETIQNFLQVQLPFFSKLMVI